MKVKILKLLKEDAYIIYSLADHSEKNWATICNSRPVPYKCC